MPLYDLQGSSLISYRSSVVPPPDFDQFWTDTLAEMDTAALKVTLCRVDAGLKLFDVFDVTFAGFGNNPIRSWLIHPHNHKHLPVVVKFIGYNGGRGFPQEHLLWPAAGYAVLVMDTRGQGSGWSMGHTGDPVGAGPAQPGFLTRGLLERQFYFYRRVFADACRAVQTAHSIDQLDAERVAVIGASQGGGIALATTGLVPGLRAALIDVPFLCDFPRAVTLAQREPYLEIARYLASHRSDTSIAFETLRYFDGVCFAERATAPALFSVAFMDTICPPSTVYAAFNSYSGTSKSIVEYRFNDHEGGGAAHEERQLEWLASRL